MDLKVVDGAQSGNVSSGENIDNVITSLKVPLTVQKALLAACIRPATLGYYWLLEAGIHITS